MKDKPIRPTCSKCNKKPVRKIEFMDGRLAYGDICNKCWEKLIMGAMIPLGIRDNP